jgi:hypothetical protein
MRIRRWAVNHIDINQRGGNTVLRKAVVMAAGLGMAAGFGLVGMGAASAVEPAAGHIHNGSTWTIEVNGGSCVLEVFSSNGTFSSPYGGDAGTWSQTAGTMNMKWTTGIDTGSKFKGTYKASPPEFVGKFGGIGKGSTGELVKGAVPGC